MTAVDIVYYAVGLAVAAFFAVFALTSVRERRYRAVVVSVALLVLVVAIWLIWCALFSSQTIIAFIPAVVAVVSTMVFFLPLGRSQRIEIGDITERVDERDTMFAREEYQPGMEKYQSYYARRPELKDVDDKIRNLPELLAPGGTYYDPIRSPYTDSIFKVIEGLTTKVDGDVAPDGRETDADTITRLVKELSHHLGADEVGIARLNPAYVYSHVGRGPEPWGEPIDNTHRYAIAFTVEMKYDNVEAAPRLAITEETARAYLDAAVISITLAQFIRDLGYPARAHISGSNYQIMLPPVAYDAGLGELGRHGYLISRKFGSRIRLGAVTTDMPLIPDRPIVFGVQDFCDICRRCAVNCPSGSIPAGEKTDVRSVRKWPLRIESCFHYWRAIGTDCGLCMKVCPFSHPPTAVHNLIRRAIKRNPLARRVAVYGEDLFYGRKAAYPKASINHESVNKDLHQ
jgi:ferredoxin